MVPFESGCCEELLKNVGGGMYFAQGGRMKWRDKNGETSIHVHSQVAAAGWDKGANQGAALQVAALSDLQVPLVTFSSPLSRPSSLPSGYYLHPPSYNLISLTAVIPSLLHQNL